MEANKILDADILDIIFEGKNKLYGAYQLRKSYNKTLSKALFSTGGFLILAFLGAALTSNSHNKTLLEVSGPIELAHVNETTPPPPVIPTPPPITPQVKQHAFTNPVIVNNDLVDPNHPITDLPDDAQISTQTVNTDNTNPVVQAPIDDPNSNAIQIPVKKNPEPDIWTTVEIEADFPGGTGAWKKYLEKNLDPETAINNGAPEGTYTVKVIFVVSADGSISNVQAQTQHGYGLESEAIKIISKGPKWIPALQNGRHVNAYRIQTITFVVGNS